MSSYKNHIFVYQKNDNYRLFFIINYIFLIYYRKYNSLINNELYLKW